MIFLWKKLQNRKNCDLTKNTFCSIFPVLINLQTCTIPYFKGNFKITNLFLYHGWTTVASGAARDENVSLLFSWHPLHGLGVTLTHLYLCIQLHIHKQSSTLCDFSRNHIRSNDLFQKTFFYLLRLFQLSIHYLRWLQELNSKQNKFYLLIPNLFFSQLKVSKSRKKIVVTHSGYPECFSFVIWEKLRLDNFVSRWTDL